MNNLSCAGLFTLTFLFFSLALPQNTLAQPIYVIKEKDGVLRFTNKTPNSSQTFQEFTRTRGSVSWITGGHRYKGKLFSNVFEDEIQTAAQLHQLSPELIRAVIHAESGFNARAVSPKGARGLMQLMPATAQELGVQNSFDPKQNVAAGSRYLAGLIERYEGNMRKALAAYNAGPGAVDNFKGIPPYAETIAYVERVIMLAKRYGSKHFLHGASGPNERGSRAR